MHQRCSALRRFLSTHRSEDSPPCDPPDPSTCPPPTGRTACRKTAATMERTLRPPTLSPPRPQSQILVRSSSLSRSLTPTSPAQLFGRSTGTPSTPRARLPVATRRARSRCAAYRSHCPPAHGVLQPPR